jgi:hypothetical protein
MVEGNSSAALALIDDSLERLGKARLSLGLAGDLLASSRKELDTAGDAIASAAVQLRELANGMH